MRRILTAVGLAVALVSLMATWNVAQAQYPPPSGSLSLVTTTTNPTPGSTITITATARDPGGSAVAGIACTFGIISQPGLSAIVDPGPYMTSPAGVATTTLQVGDTPGNVVVGATCGGTLTSQVLVSVAGPTTTAPAGLPATGQGRESSKPIAWIGGLALGGLLALGMGFGLRRKVMRRSKK